MAAYLLTLIKYNRKDTAIELMLWFIRLVECEAVDKRVALMSSCSTSSSCGMGVVENFSTTMNDSYMMWVMLAHEDSVDAMVL
ncbi:hypothetical protein GUJ93_ZPchr0012g20986 [Zizania palustris]|uniref:Uncharacterized protein n=1 Tax=Zizania palustris TaxID=103762 RepID=A0A8J5WWP4_ZIZPA|nr:hypothetical protein GUJ93_ZPchr0012g20986 [Zizania palustris]